MSSVSQNKIADDGDHARNSNDAETDANGCLLAQNPERDNGSDTRKPGNRADSLRPCCRTAVVAGRISPLILDCVHNNMFLSNTSNARCRLTSKLSDRRTDMSQPETPRQNPKAQPGSLQRLVRHPKVHHSKISGPLLSAKTE